MELAQKAESFLLSAEGVSAGPIAVRLAKNEAEIEAAQKLRYDIFYKEYGAKPVGDMLTLERDYDKFDAVADHLIVIDRRINTVPERVVGTYRLIRSEQAAKIGGFYSEDEYDISDLKQAVPSLMEVGRSCVHPDYRSRNVLQLLWQGIAEYIMHHNVGALFGCASFHGTNLDELSETLSYLHHFHIAPDDCCPRALPNLYHSMDLQAKDTINQRRMFLMLPPLVKGYLRLGGYIGDGAVVDEQFNTTDVCVVVRTDAMSDRYRKHYERKAGTPFEGSDEQVDASSEII